MTSATRRFRRGVYHTVVRIDLEQGKAAVRDVGARAALAGLKDWLQLTLGEAPRV
jgi:hypothetical protein